MLQSGRAQRTNEYAEARPQPSKARAGFLFSGNYSMRWNSRCEVLGGRKTCGIAVEYYKQQNIVEFLIIGQKGQTQ
jgi:hypothetical protein